MGQLILRPEVIQKIKGSGELFAKVAEAVEVSIFTLPALIKKNDPRLTLTSVMRVLKTSLNEHNEDKLLMERPLERKRRVVQKSAA